MKNLCQFQELHLDSNEIKTEGGIAVCEAMENKHELEALNLDANQFGKLPFYYWDKWAINIHRHSSQQLVLYN